MKRGLLIFSIIFFLIILIGVNSIEDEDTKVDQEVVDKVQTEGKAKVIVVLKDEVEKDYGVLSVTENVNVEDVKDDLNLEVEREFNIIKGFSVEIDSNELNELIEDGRVKSIEYDRQFFALLSDSVPLINASLVHVLQSGNVNITGIGETVCVIDSGIDYNHEDLGGCFGDNCKVIGGYDFVNNDNDPDDDHGHGTHVAGIVAGDNETYKGVAPGAKLVAIKVLDSSGSGTTANIISGIDWCVTNANSYNISVISMSLGDNLNYTSYCDDDYSGFSSSINVAVANNIIVSVASGNDGNKTGISSPACIQNATSIASTTKSDVISSFSNRASILDFLAPGEDIISAQLSSGFVSRSGTSMAAPHFAGVVALMRQFFNLETGSSLNTDEVNSNLTEFGINITDTDGEGLVFPRIDIYNTINSMDNYSPRVDISLSSDILELNESLTINVSYYDVFLDSYNANISYPDGSLLSNFIDSLDLVSDNFTQLGIYTVTGLANDTNFNENLTSKTFLVRDTSGLNSNSFIFNTVDNNNFTDNEDVLFNITVNSLYNLTNATLNHNFTEWHENETINNIDINETELIFNNNFTDGIYLWNLEVCDLNNYCVNSENKTLYVDQSSPLVGLVSPSNSSSLTVNPVNFNFNVSDYAISSCNFNLNENLNTTLNNGFNLSSNNYVSLILSNGDYNWSVDCLDNVDKTGYSENFSLSMSCNSESTFSRDCGSWSDCFGDKKSRLCYDSNYCTNESQNITSTFGSCEDDDDDDGGSSSGGGSSGSSGGSGSTTTTTATDTSSFNFQANAGDKKKFSISKDVGISGLEIDFKNTKNGASIVVEKVDSKPSSVTAVSNVYKYVEIDANIDEVDIEDAKIEFKVETSWININAAGQSTNIYLNRWKDGRWGKLETLTAGIDGIYQKYIAYTPGFSYFAISADKTVNPVLATTGNTVADEEEAKVIEGTTEESTEENITINTLDRFTGFVTNNIDRIYSPYSLGVLGIIVVVLGGFLFLRFKGKITRTKDERKDSKFLKLKWLVGLSLFNLFKRKEKFKGEWKDLNKEEEKKGEENYTHDFEIKRESL